MITSKTWRALTFTFLALLAWPLSGEPGVDLGLGREPLPRAPQGDYSAPNEEFPRMAKPLYESAPAGAYVSVGTERGFIGAALSPRVTHLVLVDGDAGVASFNRVNTLLLRMAKGREDYVRLRLTASHGDWMASATDAGFTDEEKMILSERYVAWKNEVSYNAEFATFHRRPTNRFGSKFRDANYLYEEALFSRLQTMAKENRIHVGVLDFSDPRGLTHLVAQLEKQSIPLAVLDVSNAWWTFYTSPDAMVRVLTEFNRIAKPESYFLSTSQPFPTFIPRMLLGRGSIPWTYQGDTFAHIRNFRSVHDYYFYFTDNWTYRFGWKNAVVNPLMGRCHALFGVFAEPH